MASMAARVSASSRASASAASSARRRLSVYRSMWRITSISFAVSR